MRRLLVGLASVVALVVIAGAIAFFVVNEPKPTGRSGPEADQLARRVAAWSRPDAWAQTGAVEWTFGGRVRHLWDRQRGYDLVSWGPYMVYLNTSNRSGLVVADGQQIGAERAAELLQTAYERYINDSFWLNPFESMLREGTEYAIAEDPEHGTTLLVTYPSGGVTPGDTYQWIVEANGRPRAWRMWVSIIPIGGLEASWEEWTELSTGARVSTAHKTSIMDLKLENVRGAATLADLLGDQPDPFAPLVKQEQASAAPAVPASAPASVPDEPGVEPESQHGENGEGAEQ